MIKHDVIGLYVTLNGKNRIDFLIKHYTDFENYISTYREYLRDTMLDILSSSRKHSDDLGVRVQGSRTNSDPTYNAALGLVAVEKCFINNEVIRELFFDPYDCELIELALYEWHRLQKEHRKLISSMKMILSQEELEILRSYFSKEKNLNDLANDYSIEVESANKKVYRIRKKLVKSIEPWFDKYTMKASA